MNSQKSMLRDLATLPGKSLSYPLKVPKEKISLLLRLTARLFNGLVSTKIGFDFIPRKTPIILAWCRRHKLYYVDYQHGWRQEITCPECRAEFKPLKTQHRRRMKTVSRITSCSKSGSQSLCSEQSWTGILWTNVSIISRNLVSKMVAQLTYSNFQ